MPLLWRSSRESRSERCKRAFLLAPICKVLLAPTLVSDRATLWLCVVCVRYIIGTRDGCSINKAPYICPPAAASRPLYE